MFESDHPIFSTNGSAMTYSETSHDSETCQLCQTGGVSKMFSNGTSCLVTSIPTLSGKTD